MIKRILMLLMLPFFLCSCSKDMVGTISFATWGSVTEVGVLRHAINEFEKQNPDIKINFIHIPQNYFQKIHLMFASNTPPDVIFLNNLYLPIYADYLEDLTKYTDKNAFYPQTLEGMSYHGKLLGIPRDISNLVFYVNLDKTSIPNDNWTINDLIKICERTANKSEFCLNYEDSVYWIMPYLAYFGGGILDENLNNIVNSEKSIEAINFYKSLKTNNYAPEKSQVGSSTLTQMFLEGKIVFYLSGRWMYPKISEKANFNWAVINFPNGEKPQYCDVSGWSVSKKSKQKENAIKFVQFLSSKKTSEYFANTDLIVPARKDIANIVNNNKHNSKVFLEVIDKSVSTPVSKNYNKLTDRLNKELDL